MKLFKNSLFMGVVFALMLVPISSLAKDAQDPYKKIDKITKDMIEIISQHQKDYPANEKQYFHAISDLLVNTVDFNYISKKVMGSYRASATVEQRKLFTKKFRQGLVETYGRGLINYGDQKIVLIDRLPLKKGQRTLVVKQEIHSSGNVFPLRYSMARKKTGEWMVINMSISGINLREIFRKQFSQAIQQSSGDLDAVIAGWTTEAN